VKFIAKLKKRDAEKNKREVVRVVRAIKKL